MNCFHGNGCEPGAGAFLGPADGQCVDVVSMASLVVV